MPIQILPARLANQIAAGEVVERPASVVKELLENSLDAGATRIEIDIEKGGAKCIRIKDNGKGVCKDQLTLALSRHATSKISHLDDLEAIVSLGFRGEALASISSVSRLTFTSKPALQEQAWQAVAEGRDMQVNIQPAAHPQGTTVEVLDLFFNTPARRRFLKTEKTEFQHIDELIRRIALSCFEISFTLKHNGKIIRQYRAAQTKIQKEKRLASICSDSFVKGALHFQSSDNDLKISGWVSDLLSPRALPDVQYCYINGRMIRDKLINHAIKQAYASSLPEGKFPGYVIYIECNPEQVDVNVHPSKHEVRFHQARWVHDFIVRVLSETLKQAPLSDESDFSAPTLKTPEHAYSHAPEPITSASATIPQQAARKPSFSGAANYTGNYSKPVIDSRRINAYCDFVSEAQLANAANEKKQQSHIELGKVVSLIGEEHLLLKLNPRQQLLNASSSLLVLSLTRADLLVKQTQLFDAWSNGEVIAQPLLLPVRMQLDANFLAICTDFEQLFERLGFAFKIQGNKLIISKVPPLLRQAPLAKIFPALLEYLCLTDKNMSETQVHDFCLFVVKTCHQNQLDKKIWTEANAASLLDLLVGLFSQQLQEQQVSLFHEPDLSLLLQGFSDD
ncbi:MAG: DNA mismatch repair endonuclease MutL [Psychromonas sp.]|nr:DNA mismatch repair endonuclease MutL [Psychromonas sp.]